jgi:hypothetical protein
LCNIVGKELEQKRLLTGRSASAAWRTLSTSRALSGLDLDMVDQALLGYLAAPIEGPYVTFDEA